MHNNHSNKGLVNGLAIPYGKITLLILFLLLILHIISLYSPGWFLLQIQDPTRVTPVARKYPEITFGCR